MSRGTVVDLIHSAAADDALVVHSPADGAGLSDASGRMAA